MFSEIIIGPRLSRIVGRYDRQERAIIRAEQQSAIHALMAINHKIVTLDSLDQYCERNKIPDRKQGRYEWYGYHIPLREKADEYHFFHQSAFMNYPCRLALDLVTATEKGGIKTGMGLSVTLESEDGQYKISFAYPFGKNVKPFIDIYFDVLNAAPAYASKQLSAIQAFEAARKATHFEGFYIFESAFSRAGFFIGRNLCRELFGMLVRFLPRKDNPFQRMAVETYRMCGGSK